MSRISERPAEAIGAVVADPALWLIGAAGFLVRGGFLALALPIWTFPGVIEISTILGPDAIGPGGLAGRGTALALVGAGLALLVLFAALLTAAAIEIAAWGRLSASEWSEPLGRHRLPSGRAARLGMVLDLTGVGLACLVPALIAGALAVAAIVDAAYAEIVVPGSLATPLPLRIAARAAPALALVALGLVVGELLHGVASRRVLRGLAGSRGLAGRPVLGAIVALLRRPVGPLLTAAAGWFVSALALVPSLASIAICWSFVRTVYLDAAPLGPEDAPLLIAATALFVAVWLAALLLCGVASAVRAALWSAHAASTAVRTGGAPAASVERSGWSPTQAD